MRQSARNTRLRVALLNITKEPLMLETSGLKHRKETEMDTLLARLKVSGFRMPSVIVTPAT